MSAIDHRARPLLRYQQFRQAALDKIIRADVGLGHNAVTGPEVPNQHVSGRDEIGA